VKESPADVAARPAVVDDAEALGRFIAASWDAAGADAPGFAGATDEIIAELAAAETLRAIIATPERSVWVAEVAEEIVGFAATRAMDGGAVELAGIVVGANMSGRGVGTLLVERAKDAALRAGGASMTVRTEPDNSRAIAFYEARGFRPFGTAVETAGDRELEVLELAADLTEAADEEQR